MSIKNKKWRVFFITLSSAIAIASVSLLLYIMGVRSSAYPYDTRMDYAYDFHGTDARIIDLQLKDGRCKLPTFHDTNYSIFLKIDISTTFMGRFFQPEARLSADNVSICDYFENGAEGIRYINITPLTSLYQVGDKFNKESVELELTGIRVRFRDQPVKLIIFRNRDILKSRILIVAPHPDDAEIAALGLYSSNKSAYIVTVTAGDAGTYQYDELYINRKNHFLKKGRIRTWNSIAVPLLAGISPDRVLNLGLFDGTLETMFRVNPANVKALYTGISNIDVFRNQNISPLVTLLTGGADWNSLVTNFENLLNRIQPDIIITPYPALDRHPDHKFTSIALFEAIKRADIRSGSLYLYTNHLVLNEYYPYGNMGGVISLPPAFSDSPFFKGPIYFRSIYSHTLSAERQKDKILSLDAMNDLRPDTTWRFSKDAVKMAITSLRRDILGQSASYYRRAVRNNELFFVVDIRDIHDQQIVDRITAEDLQL